TALCIIADAPRLRGAAGLADQRTLDLRVPSAHLHFVGLPGRREPRAERQQRCAPFLRWRLGRRTFGAPKLELLIIHDHLVADARRALAQELHVGLIILDDIIMLGAGRFGVEAQAAFASHLRRDIAVALLEEGACLAAAV